MGSAMDTVRRKYILCDLPLLIVQGDAASLLGRNWFASLGIAALSIHQTLTGPDVFPPAHGKINSVFYTDLTG